MNSHLIGRVMRWVLGGALWFCATLSVAQQRREIYLDEITAKLAVKQGWGNLGVKTAAWTPAGAKPLRLRIGGKEYDRGLGNHAPGEIRIALEGRYQAFKAEAGVQWMGRRGGSVVFQAWVDGKKRFDSGVMRGGDPAKPVSIPLSGARELRLVASDAGDGISCDMADWAEARLVSDSVLPEAGAPEFALSDGKVGQPVAMEGSQALLGRSEGSQIAFSRPLRRCALAIKNGEQGSVTLPLEGIGGAFTVRAEVAHLGGAPADAWLSLGSGTRSEARIKEGKATLTLSVDGKKKTDRLTLGIAAKTGETAACWVSVQYVSGSETLNLELIPPPVAGTQLATPRDVAPSPLLERALIEWDWRMQDGIGAGQRPGTYAEATSKTLTRGDALLAELETHHALPEGDAAAWREVRGEWNALRATRPPEDDARWEALWRRVHEARRRLVFANPLARTGPLVFAKQAPGVFSHQLTQYYGRYARPGGGLYVLDRPGASLAARALGAGLLPAGSLMQPEVTPDGKRVLVAFCATEASPLDTIKGQPGRYYHLYELAADGSRVRQLTSGDFDDFAPKVLPGGQIVFISTRRGGWHRCGTPGCEVYTLTLMNPDGSAIRTASFHETQEWDPAVLNDGRVIYTRWDYVDRHAVFYEQLWTARPDGSAPAAFYGNNTYNPVGVWEARAVPGSRRVMATAAPHHGMTAGSIILLDTTRGVDGAAPLTRLTPDTPFPESEAVLLPHWRSALAPEPPARTAEMERWPGQCYRSPWPLSEKFFLAAYSFDPLVGEPKGNIANMFGLYLVDAFGNMELLHRDPNISSVWPVPLRPRAMPPELPSALNAYASGESGENKSGTYYLQNVYLSNPGLPAGSIKRLRIVQVLPKSTPGANNPTVGAANASPGKQVLGTVPVEADGSAYFRAPAGLPLAFQALDGEGEAVQVMRSVSYVQAGETAACVGCHEPRQSAPAARGGRPLATRRPPSAIEPGPDGSRPLSFPILVQPVLDRHCARCHGGERPAGPKGKPPVVLTGAAQGRYTNSYNALVERVSFSAWGRGKFPEGNSEPLSQPGFFGARGSALMRMLRGGHHGVKLEADEMERLATWIDANALFYGTFDPEDQKRQQRGERIAGPALQ